MVEVIDLLTGEKRRYLDTKDANLYVEGTYVRVIRRSLSDITYYNPIKDLSEESFLVYLRDCTGKAKLYEEFGLVAELADYCVLCLYNDMHSNSKVFVHLFLDFVETYFSKKFSYAQVSSIVVDWLGVGSSKVYICLDDTDNDLKFDEDTFTNVFVNEIVDGGLL